MLHPLNDRTQIRKILENETPWIFKTGCKPTGKIQIGIPYKKRSGRFEIMRKITHEKKGKNESQWFEMRVMEKRGHVQYKYY